MRINVQNCVPGQADVPLVFPVPQREGFHCQVFGQDVMMFCSLGGVILFEMYVVPSQTYDVVGPFDEVTFGSASPFLVEFHVLGDGLEVADSTSDVMPFLNEMQKREDPRMAAVMAELAALKKVVLSSGDGPVVHFQDPGDDEFGPGHSYEEVLEDDDDEESEPPAPPRGPRRKAQDGDAGDADGSSPPEPEGAS